MAHWAALRSPRANASEAIRMHPHVPAKAARAGPRPIRQWPEKRSLRLVPRGAQCPSPIDPRHGSRPSDAPAGHGSMAFDVCPVPTGTPIDAQPKRRAALAEQTPCTKREWCPASFVASDTLRRSGRTETLTGQAIHTSKRRTAAEAATRTEEDPHLRTERRMRCPRRRACGASHARNGRLGGQRQVFRSRGRTGVRRYA